MHQKRYRRVREIQDQRVKRRMLQIVDRNESFRSLLMELSFRRLSPNIVSILFAAVVGGGAILDRGQ